MNFFALFTCMKRQIFDYNNFFAPVTFWSIFQISWIKKMTGAKKVNKVKNQFFHERQPREGIFGICL